METIYRRSQKFACENWNNHVFQLNTYFYIYTELTFNWKTLAQILDVLQYDSLGGNKISVQSDAMQIIIGLKSLIEEGAVEVQTVVMR